MIKIHIAGDFTPQNRIKRLIELEKYDLFLSTLKRFNESSDLAILNLESPVISKYAKGIEKTGPLLFSDEKAIKAIKYANFNCVTLANNHIYDYGQEGLENTMNALKENGISYVGAGLDVKSSQSTLFYELGLKTISIVNFCENEWSVAENEKGGANALNIVRNYHQISNARKESDFVIVIVHGGHEYYQLPSIRMKETYRYFIEIGADLVVNHHQHCFSGYEIYKDKFIFYGLGNLCFDKGNKGRINQLNSEGIILCVFIDKDIRYELQPIRQCADDAKIELLPSDSFNDKICELNEIINNEFLLEKYFNEHIEKIKYRYLYEFECYPNKYVFSLQKRNLFPSTITKTRIKNLLSNFMCESHRDIAYKILSAKLL